MKNKLKCVYLKHLFNKNLNRGFTRTELLLVIVMTGFMPALIMPCILHHHDLHKTQIYLSK